MICSQNWLQYKLRGNTSVRHSPRRCTPARSLQIVSARSDNTHAHSHHFPSSQLALSSHKKLFRQTQPDVSRLNPQLQQEWHTQRNSGIDEAIVNPFSFVTAVWKCSNCQHEWQARVLERTSNITNCPHCSHTGKYQLLCNDDRVPFASQWNHLKNAKDGVFPNHVKAGSLQPVWWQCTKCPQKWHHEWQASPVSRFSEPYSCCPFCSDKKPCICNDAPRS